MHGTVVLHLHSLDMLPAIVFCFSRRTCELIAMQMGRVLQEMHSSPDDCSANAMDQAASVTLASLEIAAAANITTSAPAREEPAHASQASAPPSGLPSCGGEPRMLLISPREVK